MKSSGIKVATYACPACAQQVGLQHGKAQRLLHDKPVECAKCGADDLLAGASRETLEQHLSKMEIAAKKYSRVVLVTVPVILTALALHFFGKIPTTVFAVIFLIAMCVQIMGKPDKSVRAPIKIKLERSSRPE